MVTKWCQCYVCMSGHVPKSDVCQEVRDGDGDQCVALIVRQHHIQLADFKC
jgi:hypothetical protein